MNIVIVPRVDKIHISFYSVRLCMLRRLTSIEFIFQHPYGRVAPT
jgi:hypothetical protein